MARISLCILFESWHCLLPRLCCCAFYERLALELHVSALLGQAPLINDYKEYHTDTSVHFSVSIAPEKMAEVLAAGLEKKFKLQSTVSTGALWRCWFLPGSLSHTVPVVTIAPVLQAT